MQKTLDTFKKRNMGTIIRGYNWSLFSHGETYKITLTSEDTVITTEKGDIPLGEVLYGHFLTHGLDVIPEVLQGIYDQVTQDPLYSDLEKVMDKETILRQLSQEDIDYYNEIRG